MKTKIIIYLCCILLGISVSNAQEIIKKSGPVVLPAQPGQTKIIASGQSLIVTSNSSVTLSAGFHAQSGSNISVGITSQNIYPIPPVINNINPELNWVLSRTFNERGDTIGESKSFFDLGGRPLQNQVKSFSTQHVFATQSIYDRFGNAAIQTLSAPINSSGFSYKRDFVRNTSGLPYNLNNFDVNAKLNAPDAVDASQTGTLGWYYSNNNSWDPYVPATAYPYSRTDYLLDGSGGTARTAGIGEQLKMGMGREVSGGSFAAYQQLSNYLSVRKKFFADTDMGNVDQQDLLGSAVENVSKDQQGNWGVTFADKDGKVLMTALAGNWLTVNNTVDLTAYNEQFVIDGNIGDYSKGVIVKGAGKLKVYDNNVLVYNGNISSYIPPAAVNSSHILKLKSNKPFSVSYGLVYNTSSYDMVCEPCVSKINTDIAQIGQDFHYFNLTKTGSLGITGGTISLTNIVSNTVETNYASLPPGMYKAVALSGEPKISYSSGYGDISYNFYNQKGELIASIAPNGVQQLITKGIGTYANKDQIPFINLFEYDKQGRLVASKSTDGGRTEYIYRKDGNIRFSQNAEQRKTGRFSYTNYDEVSRAIEAGEYVPGSIKFEAAKLNNSLLENVSSDGGLTGGTRKDWIRTHYDLKDNSHGLANYQQDFVDGAVSWTENENSKSWFSYDDQGNVVWTVRQLNGLGVKTIDYIYDFLGNVINVAYQKGMPAESFYHYYTYDADQRLVNVQTSTDGISKKQQANYQYYLHGPLKRIELADNLQGIDYTYTAQGLLKTINNSDSPADPGKDGILNSFAPDAFSMNLEYFSGDYARSGSGINSLVTGNPKIWYNGNIAGQSWKSQKPNSVVATYGTAVNNPAMFTYDYDDKYQFQSNKYGAPNLSTNSFIEAANANRESNLGYDANGNITNLNRSNAAGVSTANFSYSYQPNTNKLQSVGNYASYGYDDLGQMITQQKTAGASFYTTYNLNGKITGIYSDAAKTQLKVSFAYDETGMRIRKTDHVQNITTYYVYDLGGAALAIYDNNGGSLSQKEIPLYASGRIGMYRRVNNTYQYELTDHLGNVRVVLNQNKINGKVDVASYSDYYPFGTPLTLANNDYRYGFQGRYAEADKETGWNSFELRMYDPAIGRWLNIDPENEFYSPYLAMGNNPVSIVDPDGGSTEDPPEKTYLGNNGKTLNEVVIRGERMSPHQRVSARSERGLEGASLLFYSNGKKDIGAEIFMQNYVSYQRIKAAQPDFEGHILNGAMLLTGAGEMIEGGAALYGLGRYGFRKLLQRGIVAEVVTKEGEQLLLGAGKFPKLDVKFSKHAMEWSQWGSISKAGYYSRAVSLAESNIGGRVLGFTSEAGTNFRFNTFTGEFLTVHPKGYIQTFFRPTNGMDYYLGQIAKYGN